MELADFELARRTLPGQSHYILDASLALALAGPVEHERNWRSGTRQGLD